VILVDAREPKFYEDRLRGYGIEVAREELDACDYVVKAGGVEVGVERKEVSDYINSIVDGRLFRQLYLMSCYYPLSYLAVVGYVSPVLSQRRFRREAYISSLIGASLKRSPEGARGQVVTVNLETEFDFVLFMYLLHRKLEEGDFERVPRPPNINKSEPTALVKAIYAMLPGVGEKKAEKLYQCFPTLEDLVRASPTSLQVVLGKKTGLKVYRFIHGVRNR